MLTIKTLMNDLALGKTLDESEISKALELLSSKEASGEQMAAFLMALRVRGETIEELTGAARFLREQMIPVNAPSGAVDIVGTGGDSHGTYNVSTCAALVAAGAGIAVAKHGNRSVSSKSGASDVLQALGVKLDVGPQTVSEAIDGAGVGFMWAPMHHSVMKEWAPVRAQLGIRTLFNLLGPVCNPAGVTRQVVGVFDKRWLEPVANVLLNLGAQHAWVVHGSDGLDEMTTTGVTHVAEVIDRTITVFEMTPEDAGLSRSTLDELKGGDANVNAQAIRDVLEGSQGPFRDIVVLNAAAALIVGNRATNLDDGVSKAQLAIDSGKAAQSLAQLIEITNA